MAAVEHTFPETDFDEVDGITFNELSDDEFSALFDARARELLGMSGEEFIKKLVSGEVADLDHSSVVMLEMMIPFLAR